MKNMNILASEISNTLQIYMPYIIDAFAKVYRQKDPKLIEQRINKAYIYTNNHVGGVENYLWYLLECKQKELAIKFLKMIGLDISKYQTENYAEELDEDINNLIKKYIGNYKNIYDLVEYTGEGIQAWKFDEDEDIDLEQKRIEFINFLRGETKDPITKDTFQEFRKTDEYNQISFKIAKCILVKSDIKQEYIDYQEELKPYIEYMRQEKRKKHDIYTKKIEMIYNQIEQHLPIDIKQYLDNSTVDKRKIVVGELGEKSYIEYFSKKDEDKLHDMSVNPKDKDEIYEYRAKYLSFMGYEIDAISLKSGEKDENEYKRLIPSQELVQEIIEQKEKAQREYITSGEDYIRNSSYYNSDNYTEEDIEHMYEILTNPKNNSLCIFGAYNKQHKEVIPVFYLTQMYGMPGASEHIILHELGHIVEFEGILKEDDYDYRSGLENGHNGPKNPYNSKKRKYERTNETIRDMLTMEVSEILHEQGIYIFEGKELMRDSINDNTSSICKDLLRPFLNNYREPLTDALLYGNIKELYNIIGEENFEELVDIVNKVDNYVENQKLKKKLEDMQNDDPIVVEYYEQLERLSKVYDNMERHQLKGESTNELLQSAISATEERTRLGSINDVAAIIINTFEKDKSNQKYIEGEELDK